MDASPASRAPSPTSRASSLANSLGDVVEALRALLQGPARISVAFASRRDSSAQKPAHQAAESQMSPQPTPRNSLCDDMDEPTEFNFAVIRPDILKALHKGGISAA
jgi:hypothetical protein